MRFYLSDVVCWYSYFDCFLCFQSEPIVSDDHESTEAEVTASLQSLIRPQRSTRIQNSSVNNEKLAIDENVLEDQIQNDSSSSRSSNSTHSDLKDVKSDQINRPSDFIPFTKFATLKSHKSAVSTIAVNSKGSRFVSGGRDGEVGEG